MGLFGKVFGGKQAEPVDPSSFTTLWGLAGQLPDPYTDDRAATRQVVQVLGDHLETFLDEFRAAFELLGTPEHARHVAPWPWRGAEQPFSVRRFGLVRERAIVRGQAFFQQVLADPAQLAAIDSGPEPSLTDLYLGDDLPDSLHDQLMWAGHHAGLTERTEGIDVFDYPTPEGWPGVPRAYRWLDHDPENPALGLEVRVVDDSLDSIQVALPPELVELEAEIAEVEASASPELRALMGERNAPAVTMLHHSAQRAGAQLWDALGRPSRFEDHSLMFGVNVVLEVGDAWRRPTATRTEIVAMVDGHHLLSLPYDRQVSPLVAVLAHCVLSALGKGSPDREALTRVRDTHATELPADARAGLRID